MDALKLRREIKNAINRIPAERLASLADYIEFLTRQTLSERLHAAEKAIASGKGSNWRKVRANV